MLVAVLGNGQAFDQLHHEVGVAARRSAGIEDGGDVRMIHQRQRLPLRLEAGNYLSRVHAWLDDLERNLTAHRLLLFGQEDRSHTALADLLHEQIRTDTASWPFA